MAEGTTRTERDSMGEIQVPADCLYGAQTARAVENFPISGRPLPQGFITTLAAIKLAAAEANCRLGLLDEQHACWIIQAAGEILDGKFEDQFPVDIFQTGSGTSTNMNVNEVIANRAIQIAGGEVGSKTPVHPNDHVNLGQSSNDVIPTAVNVATASAIRHWLLPQLQLLAGALAEKARTFDDVIKIGRTHLQDAVPIRLGQEFSGYAASLSNCCDRLEYVVGELCALPIGGTAVGTGLNTHPEFADQVCRRLSEMFDLPMHQAENHFAAQSNLDWPVTAAATLKSTALVLGKIAGDIRLMASGPRCGLGEINLPETQPGSSIMPGKVNPVICESVVQVACQVVGCEAAVSAGATGGVGSIMELNMAMPMIADNLLEAVELLTNVSEVFRIRCVEGITPNRERCEELVERSLAMCTVLAREVGYDKAAAIAKQAYGEGKTIREVALAQGVIDSDKLAELLDPRSQTN